MYRPKGVADHRFVGDKRTGVVHDLDAVAADGDGAGAATAGTPRAVIDELLDSGLYICFAPDTLAEARNRGYRLRRGNPLCRALARGRAAWSRNRS